MQGPLLPRTCHHKTETLPASAPIRPLRLVSETRSAPKRPLGAEFSDVQLVAMAKKGDRLAREALYRRHAGFAMNLAVRIQGGPADVEDVTHDAFLRAFHRLGELRDAALFRPWLGAIVVRLVRTRLRRVRLLRTLGLGSADSVDLDAIASSEAGPEARAQLAQVYALLRTLNPNERIAWTLRFIERQPLESVAALSGCSLATAKRRLRRAQQFLNDHFVSPRAKQ